MFVIRTTPKFSLRIWQVSIANSSSHLKVIITFDDPRDDMWRDKMSRVNNKRFGSVWISGSRLEVIAARIAASPRPRASRAAPRPPAAVSKQSGVYPHLARTDRSAACRGALAVPIIFVTGIAPKPIPASSGREESQSRASPRPRSPAGSRLCDTSVQPRIMHFKETFGMSERSRRNSRCKGTCDVRARRASCANVGRRAS